MVNIKKRPRPSDTMLTRFIQDSIKLGLSANESLRRLQALGYGMRRQEFLRVFREIANLPARKDAFKSLPYDKVFSSKHYTINENRVSGFRSIFKVRAVRADGITGTKLITIKHDKPLTKREFIKRVKELAKQLYINERGDVSSGEEPLDDEAQAVDVEIESFEGGTKGWID